MQRDLLRDDGVALWYKQAWRSKEDTNDMIYGSAILSYDLLLWYAGKVLQVNSISVVQVESEEGCFKRVFFSFGLSLYCLTPGCRRMMFVDGTHLLGKYGEHL